ncbi:MAG TPA: protein kinase [Bryobacteraceae bacterium]|nr:protein kinase [Bryobacteraceae bacterium]
MTSERWQLVERLYHGALERKMAERLAFLEQACGTDGELRREVESLLVQNDTGDGFLEAPAMEVEAKEVARERSSPEDRHGPDGAGKLASDTLSGETKTEEVVATKPAGTRFGRYEIVGLLGAGGMGEVYRAADPQLGREVAIKILPRETTGDPQALARFHREARIIAALSHPNLLSVYDFGEHQGLSYTVTELLEGETLRGRLRRSPPDWRGAAEIAATVAEGLAAAHFQRIVHLDLKPENVFLTNPVDGSPSRTVILDFGLARWMPSGFGKKEAAPAITEAGMVMGTVAYMSPERARGEPAGAASDIFSLGCVLYEMLAGHPPFERPTHAEVLSAILRDDFAPLPRAVPSDLIHLVTRCLEKTLERRCQSARFLASSLRSILAGNPLTGAAVPTHESLIDSLAVMPFQNTSGSADTDFLSDGITESLINSFSRLPGMRVVARSRVFRYKNRDIDTGTLGRELGVRALLTGRVLQRGETLRVQAELVDAASETQIWGERFQGKPADILAFEDEIATQIAAKLRPRLRSGEKRPKRTGDPQAYRFYLQGLHLWHQRTGTSLAQALEYFERAIQADPEYALPYHGLAEALIVLTFFNAGVPKQYLERALAAASRAVAIDPDFGPGWAALAHARGWLNHDWAEANADMERAVQADPNSALVHDRRALLFLAQGRSDEAIAAQLRSLEIEPLSLSLQHHAAWCFLLASQYERAAAQSRQLLELDPKYPFACLWLAASRERLGHYEAAQAAFQQMGPDFGGNPVFRAFTGHLFGVMGRIDDALAILSEGERLWERGYFEPFALALISVALGRTDAALDWLDRAAEARSSWLAVHAALDSRLDPLRGHPRFHKLMVRMRLAA